MKGFKWDDAKHQWQIGNVKDLQANTTCLVVSIDKGNVVVLYSTPSSKMFDYMKMPYPTNLPIYEGMPVACVYKDVGHTRYKKVCGKGIDATREHLKRFNFQISCTGIF